MEGVQGFQGGIPPFLFLTVLLGVTPFYAVFLPRLIDSTDDESRTPGHRPRHWLVTLYATEILGSLVGLALVVVLSPANMRYILSLHLAGLGVLTFLWARARWRFFVPALAALPALYLVCFPALDRASISYFYRYRSELQRVDVLASEFSPYQRVDIFNGHEKQGMATYLYLNGNLFYGTSILNQHNLFVSILPNLMVPHPSNALVIGGGSLDNARHLAPRVGRLRIVELDATVVRLSREHIQERRGGFPTNWDLTLDDGKHFLGVYDGPLFDVISIDVPVPTFLQTAMLHSDRFFALARTRLAPGGVFSISLSGTYYAGGPSLNPRQSHLAHRVMAGLLKNFRHVTVVQGAGRDYAWASDRPLAFTSKEVFSRAVAFVEESGTKDEFKLPEFRFLEESEVRSRAKGFAPVGEADMQIALRMSINKLMTRFYDTGE